MYKRQAKRGVINSIYIDTETLSVHNDELQACYREITANEQQWEEYNLCLLYTSMMTAGA